MCSFLAVEDRRTYLRTCHEVAEEEGELTEQLKQELRAERNRITEQLDEYDMSAEQQQRLVAINQAIEAITLQNAPALRRLVGQMRVLLGHIPAEAFALLKEAKLTHFRDALEIAKVVHGALQLAKEKDRRNFFLGIVNPPLAQNPPDIGRALEIADAMPNEELRGSVLHKIVIALLAQNPPDIKRALVVAHAMPDANRLAKSSALYKIVEALLAQNPPAIERAREVANARPIGREITLRLIVDALLAQNPPDIERALVVADEMPDHTLAKSYALRDIVKALLAQNPPAIERAYAVAKAKPEGVGYYARLELVLALVCQKPPAIERAREVVNEMSSDSHKSDAFGEIVKALLAQNPHAIEQAREFVNSIPERWRSEALNAIAEAESRASSAKGEKS